MDDGFATRRALALAVLTDHHATVSRRAGQFLGQIAVDETPLSERQARWLGQIAERAGLAFDGGARD